MHANVVNVSNSLLTRGRFSGMQLQYCLVMSAARQQSSGARVGPTYRSSSAMRSKALDAGGSFFARLGLAVAPDVGRG